MKIVHINTFDKGGAGKAAIRLHNSLLSKNIDSYFLTLGNNEEISNKIVIPKFQPTFLQKVSNKLGLPLTRLHKNETILKDTTGKYEFFSFPYTDYQLHEHPDVVSADIIHLHWVSNFVDIYSFFKNIKKPIIWTLHDMNPFFGGFHYRNDQITNQENFQTLEQNFLESKKKAYRHKDNLHIVTLCNWMTEEVKNNSILQKYPIHKIPNSIDVSIFKPHPKETIRQKLDIPLDKKVILFISEHVDNFRKGFDLLEKALQEVLPKWNDQLHLVCIGNVKNKIQQNNIQHIEYISKEQDISELYAAADLFILPSREDNLPNVMLESLCSGTPVISYSIGGMKEHISHQNNGYLADLSKKNSLANTIDLFLNEGVKLSREEISKQAHQKFSFHRQSETFQDLYHQIIQ